MYQVKIQYFPNDELRAVMSLQKNSSGSKLSCVPPEESSAEPEESYFEIPQDGSRSASLTLDSNSEPGVNGCKPGFGKLGKPTKFGLNAKRTILRCAGALERTYPRESCVFFTGTLPGSTQESFRAIAEWSSWLVDALKSWIAKRVKTAHSFYVWEWQKRGALHLHYAVIVEDEAIRKKLIDDFKMQWYRLIKTMSKKSGVDCFARGKGGSWKNYPKMVQAYAQSIKKTIGGYLAKYCSKNAGKVADGYYHPVRWWGCSRPSIALMRGLTRERLLENLSFNAAKNRIANIEQLSLDVARKRYTYLHKVGLGVTHVAYSFIDGIQQVWSNLMSKYPIRLVVQNESSSMTLSETAMRSTCLNIFEHLSSISVTRNLESTRFLGRLLEDLELRCTQQYQSIATLQAFASTVKSHQLCRFLTWNQKSSLQLISKHSSKELERWQMENLRTDSSSLNNENTVDTNPNFSQHRMKPTDEGGTHDRKSDATKDIIPQRSLIYEQLRLL